MLLNQIKQVNLKCSPKQCGVLEITNKLCANKLGEHSSLWTSILHRNHRKFTNAVTIVSFKFAVYQNDEIISTALHVKKKMLVAVHTSTINTVQREPEILTNSEIIKGFVCWMYQCLIKFSQKYMFIVFLNFPLIIKL